MHISRAETGHLFYFNWVSVLTGVVPLEGQLLLMSKSKIASPATIFQATKLPSTLTCMFRIELIIYSRLFNEFIPLFCSRIMHKLVLIFVDLFAIQN